MGESALHFLAFVALGAVLTHLLNVCAIRSTMVGALITPMVWFFAGVALSAMASIVMLLLGWWVKPEQDGIVPWVLAAAATFVCSVVYLYMRTRKAPTR